MSLSLTELPLDEIRRVLRQHAVRIAYVFGSMARGTASPGSDLDLAVLFTEPWDAHRSFDVAAQIQTTITRLVHRPVEVLVLNDANALARFEATCHGLTLLCENEDERIRFELRVRSQYEDYLHIQSFYVQALRERLRDKSRAS